MVRIWNSVIEKLKFWRWATLRLDRENYQEKMQSLMSQTQVSNFQIRVEEEENNSWVFHILEDLVTAMLDDGLHLKSLDTAGSGNSSIDWASLSLLHCWPNFWSFWKRADLMAMVRHKS